MNVASRPVSSPWDFERNRDVTPAIGVACLRNQILLVRGVPSSAEVSGLEGAFQSSGFGQ